MPVTVAALENEVTSLCGLTLGEAGVLFRAADADNNPFTPVIRIGLRKGLKDVGIAPADPLALADADLANLSPFAAERVLAWGQLFALEQALLHWYRALKKYRVGAVEAQPMLGGWLMEEKRAARDRVAELKAIVATPYIEPSDPIDVAGHPWPFRFVAPGSPVPVGTGCQPFGPWSSPYDPCGPFGPDDLDWGVW
jgi:hypothetical protein